MNPFCALGGGCLELHSPGAGWGLAAWERAGEAGTVAGMSFRESGQAGKTPGCTLGCSLQGGQGGHTTLSGEPGMQSCV